MPDSPNPVEPIERFEIQQDADEAAEVSEHGPWVRFEDHIAALQAEVEKREEVERKRNGLEGAAKLIKELAEGETRRWEEAESKLSSAVKKLEELGEEAERRCAECRFRLHSPAGRQQTGHLDGQAYAFKEAAQLLRDKGPEQGGGGS